MAGRSVFRLITPFQLAWISGGGIVILVAFALGAPPLVMAVVTLVWAIVTIILGLKMLGDRKRRISER